MDQKNIITPLTGAIGLIIIFALFPLMTSSVNSWFMLATPACVIDGERLDRVVIDGPAYTDGSSPTAIWGDSAKPIYSLKEGATVGDCVINKAERAALTLTAGAGQKFVGYTVAGNKWSHSPDDTATTITGGVTGEWMEAAGVFTTGGFSLLIKLVLSAAGLGLPIGALLGLAMFGSSFLQNYVKSPLMGGIMIVVAMVLVGTLVGVITPFVDGVSDSLDGERYAMYREGIGALANIIGSFFGIVMVAGIVFLGWKVIGHFRSAQGGGNIFSGNSM